MTKPQNSEGKESSLDWRDPRILVTAGLLSLLLLHLSHAIHVDQQALILIVIVLAVWLAPLIEELQIAEYLKLKLKAAETDLEISKLEAISRLSQKSLRVLIPDWEFQILDELANNENYERNTNEDMHLYYKDLFHLLELGLIQRVDPDRRIPSGQGKQKVRDFYRVTPLGAEYLDLRKTEASESGSSPS